MSGMATSGPIAYAKMNGIGNAILVVDLRGSQIVLDADDARRLAGRPATRFDQLMALHDPVTAGTEAYIRIYNSDGSAAGACGNGMRCVAWRIAGARPHEAMRLETVTGVLTAGVESIDRITVDMGEPRFRWDEIPLSEPFHDTRAIELQIGPIDRPLLHSPAVVNVGNPHAVFFVGDAAAYDLGRFGPMLEHHPLFPDRANISLAEVRSRRAIRLRTWERGAGLTRACGSAACAAAVTAARKGLTERKVTVSLPGGDLEIEWTAGNRILMTGAVELEHEGIADPASTA
jgi:diaminopimelate epimerase